MKKPALLGLACLLLSACSAFFGAGQGQQTVSSSLVDFLYPQKEQRREHSEEIPILRLPVRVGLAFVPSANWHRDGINTAEQIALLEEVQAAFLNYDYIDHIEVIPDTYLNAGGGFDSLDQLARLYDLEIMALVSYDQVKRSLENKASLLYWTIVGAYLIPGNENSVQTFVDTAVFDIKSRSMLFRAPGLSKLEQRSTAVDVRQTMVDKSLQGFEQAVTDMTRNLDAELGRFKDRVKQEQVATIEHREGYSGAGMIDYFSLFCLSLLLFGVSRPHSRP